MHDKVVHFLDRLVPAAHGVIEFPTRGHALEANLQFNGVLLLGETVRLRADRGEFDELVASKLLSTAKKTATAPLEFSGHTVPRPPAPLRARARRADEC